MKASVGRPASIVASPRRAANAEPPNAEPPRVVISVVGFSPSPAGPVQAVVSYAADGKTRILGRIGIFPQFAFDASQPGKTQFFGLPLPAELAFDRPLRLAVDVVPTRGSGEGAFFVIGSARIE